MSGSLLVLSGPSGCGKSSLVNELLKVDNDIYFSISTTTREIRDGEVEGKNYYYISKEQFKKEIDEGLFLEWAEVHGNYYGTSLKPINNALEKSKLVIFDIDVQGFEQVVKLLGDITTTVFITTPSIKELENRLYNRDTDSKEIIEKRISNAKKEIEYIDKYDYFIVNDNLELASKQLVSVALSSLVKASLFDKNKIVKNWDTI
jgi:guanylate kinase